MVRNDTIAKTNSILFVQHLRLVRVVWYIWRIFTIQAPLPTKLIRFHLVTVLNPSQNESPISFQKPKCYTQNIYTGEPPPFPKSVKNRWIYENSLSKFCIKISKRSRTTPFLDNISIFSKLESVFVLPTPPSARGGGQVGVAGEFGDGTCSKRQRPDSSILSAAKLTRKNGSCLPIFDAFGFSAEQPRYPPNIRDVICSGPKTFDISF